MKITFAANFSTALPLASAGRWQPVFSILRGDLMQSLFDYNSVILSDKHFQQFLFHTHLLL